MTILSILLGVCIWVLGSYKLEAHEALMGSREFCSMHYAYVIVLSCLCLLDTIVELHATDENMFNDFLIEKWK
jgi:hypothetical protein